MLSLELLNTWLNQAKVLWTLFNTWADTLLAQPISHCQHPSNLTPTLGHSTLTQIGLEIGKTKTSVDLNWDFWQC